MTAPESQSLDKELPFQLALKDVLAMSPPDFLFGPHKVPVRKVRVMGTVLSIARDASGPESDIHAANGLEVGDNSKLVSDDNKVGNFRNTYELESPAGPVAAMHMELDK